ncbi:hypothetical protein CLU86_4349 [Acidovorax sp. 62]|nr:hypothetical protein CLU86_4349 [Acidovorax sp. 62]
MRGYRYQGGQVIVYLLAIIPAVCLGIFIVFNTAVTAREKMKLQNSADAISYSASTVFARQLNFLAYTNRAMAANEGGVALMASLQTSVGMVVSTAANIQVAGMQIEAQKGIWNLAQAAAAAARLDFVTAVMRLEKYAENVVAAAKYAKRADNIAEVISPSAKPFQLMADALRVLNQAISLAQAATTGASIPEAVVIAKDVLNENDPNAYLPTAANAPLIATSSLEVLDFIRLYKTTDDRDNGEEDFSDAMRFAHAAQTTRDDFTKERRILPLLFSDGIGKLQSDGASFDAGDSPVAAALQALIQGAVSWKGGTELVATRGSTLLQERGRIRWQSADALMVAGTGPLLGERVIGDFGMGAAAATSGRWYDDSGWSGKRLALRSYDESFKPTNVDPTYQNDEKRDYGKLTKDGLWSSAIYGAGRDDDGDILATPIIVGQYGAAYKYKPRTEIGLVTNNFSMPRYWDVRQVRSFKAKDQDKWWSDLAMTSVNPRKWGSLTDNGPTISVVVGKKGSDIGTAEQSRHGWAGRENSVGLKDKLFGGDISVLSSAQLYFKRPQDRWQRRDLTKDDYKVVTIAGKSIQIGFTGGYVEHKSLFSPYWQVHNVEPSIWARGVAVAGVALSGSEGVFSGSSEADNSDANR